MLRLASKGNKGATMPLPVPRALLAAADERTTGPVELTKSGKT